MRSGALQYTTANRRDAVAAKAWALVERLGIFGYAEISSELSIPQEVATQIVKAWEAEGRVQMKHGGSGNQRKKFEITRAYRQPKARVDQIAQQLWNGMRGLKSFSHVDLAAHCRADLKVEPKEASEYCQALLRAGYLRVARTAIPNVRPAIYSLIRNTGIRAPRERRVRAVWDENEAQFVYIAGAGRLGGDA